MRRIVVISWMRLRRPLLVPLALSVLLSSGVLAQAASSWRDPSPHRSVLITVDTDVMLEVLDWGGSGRPIVLLSGLGNTAHVFDDFAPPLTDVAHVVGITRRGYGASSLASTGYDVDRLSDDVLAVLDQLHLEAPLLVGHSIAGQELSAVAARHPGRVAGLVYLDGLFAYAYTTPKEREFRSALAHLRDDVQGLLAGPLSPLGVPQPADRLASAIRLLPSVQTALQALPQGPSPPGAPPPSASDEQSFAALSAYYRRVRGLPLPESELRASRLPSREGPIGPERTPEWVPQAILRGGRSFAEIRAPVLAIVASPQAGRAAWQNEAKEARLTALSQQYPTARIVRLANADHYLFLTQATEVRQALTDFLRSLH